MSDVHEISVNIADKLGATATATVHCVNGTVDDYSIDLIVTNLHDRFNETLYNGTLQLGGGASLPSKLSYGTSIGVIPQPAVLAAYNKSDPTESKPIVILIYGPNPPSWPTQKSCRFSIRSSSNATRDGATTRSKSRQSARWAAL